MHGCQIDYYYIEGLLSLRNIMFYCDSHVTIIMNIISFSIDIAIISQLICFTAEYEDLFDDQDLYTNK